MTTGSIGPTTGTTRGGLSGVGDRPVRLGTSAPRLRGYVLRDVFEGVALVEGNDGIRAVKPGFTLPEGSKVTAIERHDGKWVVVTTGGIISDEPWQGPEKLPTFREGSPPEQSDRALPARPKR